MVITETLNYLGEWSQPAENLLLGTAIQESGLGFCMRRGRRLGLYHISPSAHRAVWDHYLARFPDKASRVRGLAGQHSFIANPHLELATNLRYATASAWCIYLKAGCHIGSNMGLHDIAKVWHRHFHRRPSGTEADFVRNYRELTEGRHISAA